MLRAQIHVADFVNTSVTADSRDQPEEAVISHVDETLNLNMAEKLINAEKIQTLKI